MNFIRLLSLSYCFLCIGLPARATEDTTMIRQMIRTSRNLALNHPDSAKKIAEQCLNLTTDPFSIASSHSVIGVAMVQTGDYDSALFHNKKTLAIFQEINEESQFGNCYNNIGVVYDYMGQYDSAIYYYEKGLRSRLQTGPPGAIQGSLSNLGYVYYLKGDMNNALHYLFQSLKISESTNDNNGIVSSNINIAIIYQKLKKNDQALDLLLRAAQISEEMGWSSDIALCYNNMALIYLEQKNYDKALSLHEKALDIRLKSGDKAGIATSYQNIASYYLRKKEYEKALEYSERTIEISKSIKESITLMEAYNVMALILLETGKTAEAKNTIELCLKEAEKIEYINKYMVYQTASSIYEKTGDYKKALSYNRSYQTLLDSIESTENASILAEQEQAYKYEKKKQEDELLDAQERIKQEAELSKRKSYNYFFFIGIVFLLVVLAVIWRSLNQRKKANSLLTARNEIIIRQNKVIEEKNKDITDSIQYAQRLQNAILPSDEEMRSLGNHFLLFEPKDIVSGDFYWVTPLDKEDVLFAVIDCTGHGVPGGFVSIVAHNALTRAVNEFNLKEPSRILDKISILIDEMFSKEGKESIRDGMDIALCRLTKNKLQFSGANNPLWIIDENGCKEFKGDKQPIGSYENRKPFTQHEVELEKNQLVVLMTDGYADQFGGEKGKKFKYSQLKELLIRVRTKTPEEIKTDLSTTINSWRGDIEQIDDICVLGIITS